MTVGELIALIDQPMSEQKLPKVDAAKIETPKVSETSGVDFDSMQVIAEKTGYPKAMLGPSMELEADLGIDSIKRVEIFRAAITYTCACCFRS